MTMLKTLLDGAGSEPGEAILLNETPFLGGKGWNAVLNVSGVTGTVDIEGAYTNFDAPTADDWETIVTIDTDTPPQIEITLPRWIRVNGRGTATLILEGVQ